MEKMRQVDGKNVRFKCTAGTLIRYRNQFNREFLADLAKLEKIKDGDYAEFSLAPFENILWVMAKTADDTIPEPLAWYDSFDEFSVIDVYKQVQDILIKSIKVKNSSAAVHPATKRRGRKRR